MNVDQDNKLGKFCDNSESKSQCINMFASNTLTPKGEKKKKNVLICFCSHVFAHVSFGGLVL